MEILYKIFLLTESKAFLKFINSWCTASFYSHSFSNFWRMRNIWYIVNLLLRNTHCWSSSIYSAYGVDLDRKKLNRILFVVDKSGMPMQLLQYLITLFINGHSHQLFPPIRQFLFIPNRLIILLISVRIVLTTSFNQFCWNLMSTLWFVTI